MGFQSNQIKHQSDAPDSGAGSQSSPAEEHASSERLRASLDAILEARGLSASGWCIMAGLPESTLRNFLQKRSGTLTHATLASLADAIHEPVSALLGETDQDEVSPGLNEDGQFVLRSHDPDEIRRWITDICRRTGLPPTKLAKESGLAPSTLNRFLYSANFEFTLSSSTIEKICKFLRSEYRPNEADTNSGKTLGDRVKAVRHAKGWSQADLAREAKVKPQSIQQLEAGSIQNPRYLLQLADTLGVELRWLHAGDLVGEGSLEANAFPNHEDDTPHRTTLQLVAEAALRTIARLESGEIDAATGLAIGTNCHAVLLAEELELKVAPTGQNPRSKATA